MEIEIDPTRRKNANVVIGPYGSGKRRAVNIEVSAFVLIRLAVQHPVEGLVAIGFKQIGHLLEDAGKSPHRYRTNVLPCGTASPSRFDELGLFGGGALASYGDVEIVLPMNEVDHVPIGARRFLEGGKNVRRRFCFRRRNLDIEQASILHRSPFLLRREFQAESGGKLGGGVEAQITFTANEAGDHDRINTGTLGESVVRFVPLLNCLS